MKTFQIKCDKGKRLFDIIEGSKLSILIKCGNTKVCPYKSTCSRTTEFIVDASTLSFSFDYKPIICPHCNRRLFDATKDSVGIVTIKCELCGKISSIPILAN